MIYKLACFFFACGVATIPALAIGSMLALFSIDTGIFVGSFVFVSLVDTLMIKMPAAKK
jgi:hypothetical protein